MSKRATGTFTTVFEPLTGEEGWLGHARVLKTIEGDLIGTGRAAFVHLRLCVAVTKISPSPIASKRVLAGGLAAGGVRFASSRHTSPSRRGAWSGSIAPRMPDMD